MKYIAESISCCVVSRLVSYFTNIMDSVVIIGATASIPPYFGCMWFASSVIPSIIVPPSKNFKNRYV